MSLIIGVLCDSCGTSDIENTVDGRNIDYFPRNNWFSITQWSGEPEGRPEAEFHACSLFCLQALPKALHEQGRLEEEGHDHAH